MARFPTLSSQLIIFSILLSSAVSLVAMENEEGFVRTIDRKLFGLKEEKLSHFRLYWHDITSGPHPSAVQIVPALNTSKTAFGSVRIIDNPLTLGPELSSKLVGRAQGFYASASQEEVGLLMAMNFAFVEGKYNGSTISLLGRNTVFSAVREMPVNGGSGLFRFARGYAQLRTHKYDIETGDATVEYDIYVLHY